MSSPQIAESFRRFGITDHTSALIVIKVTAEGADAIAKQLEWAVEGEALTWSDDEIAKLSNLDEIRKIYKLNDSGKGKGDGGGAPTRKENAGDERKDLEMAVLGLMALRGAS